MRCQSILALGVALFTSSALGAECWSKLSKDAFPNCKLIEQRYALHWNTKDGKITFGATVDVDNAWFALGISENGGMKGADITVISAGSDGKLQVQDYYSTDFAPPQLDDSQDVTIDASQSSRGSGSTTAVWIRPLDTCDDDDIKIYNNIEQKVIWAIGTSDKFSRHAPTNRGTTNIALIPDPNAKAKPTDPADLGMFEVSMPNYTIPANKTTSYTCTHAQLKLPKENTKYHITKYQGIAKSKLVHHMIIYACVTPPPQLGDIYDCESMEAMCSDFTMVWAPGLDTIELPAEAGFAAGSVPGGFQYFSLQVHYDNQAKQEGVVDTSGFKIWYTEQLRENDMGVLFTGVTGFTIPPNNPSYHVAGGECPGSCTRKFGKPITLWRNAFHMHTLGKNITTRHIKNGVELEPIGVLSHYDFNFQSISDLPQGPRTLSPGDSLLTTCTFDSTTRNVSTPYGESTSQEMCFNIIQYYPRVDVSWCTAIAGAGVSTCNNQIEQAKYEQEFQAGLAANGTGNLTDAEFGKRYIEGAVKAGLMVMSDVGPFVEFKKECKQTSPSGTKAESGALAVLPSFVSLAAVVVSLALAAMV
ncbi:hypothetical protein HK097_007452 [Rhizophlyctis rosea]|uniref:DOMON domain-containing protein n=1 Tax=Rhizophlyctis rosea TaxID=64517 RepID=A0AAD5SDU6_9FUNG|nr:hypothetical protein HK097_007452 [Rhizophlyctis rosea]